MRPLTAAHLVADLCERDGPAPSLFRALLAAGQTDTTRRLRAEWQRLFRLAHEDQNKQSAIQERRAAIEALAGERFVPGDSEREYHVLFCLQTTHAILVKAVAHLVLAKQALTSLLSLDDDALRAAFVAWEEGRGFRDAGIGNVLEPDFFRWYCDRWTPAVADVLRRILRVLVQYEGHAEEDLFQDLYLRIVPPKVRHNLGEFYTPRWLAETVVERAVAGQPDGWRGLDPCCGSGTFVSVMLDRVREETQGLPAAEQLSALVTRVHGFDLNPLAVLAARVNFFVAIAPLIEGRAVEIPIFLRDASCASGLREFDVLVGNPPWIDWKNLPEGYRERVKALCVDRHLFSGDGRTGGINLNICALIANVSAENWLAPSGCMVLLMPRSLLFQQSYEGFRELRLSDGRLYVQEVVDWSEAGHPFVSVTERFFAYVLSRRPVDYRRGIPRVVMTRRPGPSASSSRRWRGDVEALYTSRAEVVGQVRPESTMFSAAATKGELEEHALVAGTCDYVGREGIEFYPQELFLHHVVAREGELVRVRNFQNPDSKYPLPEVTRLLEAEFLHPLVKGPEIGPFRHAGSEFVVPFPYDGERRPIEPGILEERAPELSRFLREHEPVIRAQTRYNEQIMGSNATQFYALARVGKYTFVPWHVGFRDNSRWGAAVFGPADTLWGGRKLPLFQNHAVSIAEHESGRFITEDEAHYVCAVLNAPIVRRYILASSDARTFKIRPPVRVPTFDPEDADHRRLVELSREAHAGGSVEEEIEERYRAVLRRGR